MRGGGGVTWLAAGADFSSFPRIVTCFPGNSAPRIAANAVLVSQEVRHEDSHEDQ